MAADTGISVLGATATVVAAKVGVDIGRGIHGASGNSTSKKVAVVVASASLEVTPRTTVKKRAIPVTGPVLGATSRVTIGIHAEGATISAMSWAAGVGTPVIGTDMFAAGETAYLVTTAYAGTPVIADLALVASGATAYFTTRAGQGTAVIGTVSSVPGDYFSNPIIMSGVSGSLSVNLADSTTEPDEPDVGTFSSSVWMKFAPEIAGTLSVNSNETSTFNHTLEIFDGDSLEDLTLLTSDDWIYGVSDSAAEVSLAIGAIGPYYVRARSHGLAGVGVAPRKVASFSPETSSGFATLLAAGAAYTGAVNYFSLGVPPAWSDSLNPGLATAHGTEPFELQVTAKTHDDAGLLDVITNLPDPWRPYFKYNIYQEPEDNLNTTTLRNAWKADYTSAANVIRSYNTAHPTKAVSLPWVELKEYGADRHYNHGDDSQSPGLFVPPLTDIGGVLWSFFEYNEPGGDTTYQPTVVAASVTQKLTNVQRAMADFFPGKPFGMMAGAYTLEPYGGPFTTAQKQNQARWLTEYYNQVVAAGSVNWAWYNVAFSGTGGASGEARVEQIAETLTAFNSLTGVSDGGTDSALSLSWSIGSRSVLTLIQDVKSGSLATTPGVVTVSVMNAEPGETLEFSMSGLGVLYSDTADSSGVLPNADVPIPALVGVGTWSLHVQGLTSGLTDDDTFQVFSNPVAPPTPPTPDGPPVGVTQTGVRKWVLQDPVSGGLSQFVFTYNPQSMNPPFAPRLVQVEHTTSLEGIPILWEGVSRGFEWEFTGYLQDQADMLALTDYFNLNRRFYLIDHRNRAWIVTFTALDLQPKRNVEQYYAHIYTVKAMIFGGFVQL